MDKYVRYYASLLLAVQENRIIIDSNPRVESAIFYGDISRSIKSGGVWISQESPTVRNILGIQKGEFVLIDMNKFNRWKCGLEPYNQPEYQKYKPRI